MPINNLTLAFGLLGATGTFGFLAKWQRWEMRFASTFQLGRWEALAAGLHTLLSWLTRIEEWVPGERFVDMQLVGPYKLWHHTHEFRADWAGGTVMRDTVRWALPFGPAGELARRAFVQRDLDGIFDFRRERVAQLIR